MDTSEIFVRLLIMWASYDSSGKSGKYSRHGLLDLMVCPFVHTTLMGVPMILMGDMVHTLLNKDMLPLYMVLLFYYYYLGFD